MYKVVLIDDEDIIVEGLQKVMDWKKYNCEVVATAGDALTGAQEIRHWHPDILFTDIRMPHMDGLTMLAGLRGEFPDMQIIVLTGYREFDYAKLALELGVIRFLLKPSRMDELNEALEAAAEAARRRSDFLPIVPDNLFDEENEAANNFVVRSALKYIEEHYTEKLTLIEVAEKTYVSQWHLSKLLNGYTSQSFNEILNQMRIKRAKTLLKDPALRIREIADMLGFSDVAHFSRVFKRIAGASPKTYRNKMV